MFSYELNFEILHKFQCENCKSDCDDCHVIRSSKRSKCTSVPIAITKEAWLRQLANKVIKSKVFNNCI